MTWDLDRQDDTLIVTFHMPIAEGWSELFDALKAGLESGARVVFFPNDLPMISSNATEVFHALINYLIGSGVQVHRGGELALVDENREQRDDRQAEDDRSPRG